MFKIGSAFGRKLSHRDGRDLLLLLLHHLPKAQLQKRGRILRAAGLHPADDHRLLLFHLLLDSEGRHSTVLSAGSDKLQL